MRQRKKKLAINLSILDDSPTGLGVYSINVVNGLVPILEKNYDIDIFTPTTKGLNINSNILYLPKYMKPKYKLFGGILRFFWNQFNLVFISKKYDIVYSPTHHGSVFIRNQIITIHDLISLNYEKINISQKLYYKLFLGKLLTNSKNIITISHFTKSEILKYFKVNLDKINVIHNGVDHSVYNTDINTDIKLNILAVGPTYPHKNFERLIKAYALLDDKLRLDHPLLIVGGYANYVSKLKKLTHALKISNHVRFLGYVNQEDLVYYYRSSLFYIYPSLYEGFGLPPLEAMACGCPSLVSRSSSLPEVCNDAAVYFDPLSINDIYEKMLWIINNEVNRSVYSNKGLERSCDFDWDNTSENIALVIKSSLEN